MINSRRHPSKLRVCNRLDNCFQSSRSPFLDRCANFSSKIEENGEKWWPWFLVSRTSWFRVSLFLLPFFRPFWRKEREEPGWPGRPTTFPRTCMAQVSISGSETLHGERKWRRPRCCLCGYRFSETIVRNSEIVFHRRRIPRLQRLNFYPRP